MVRTDMRRLDMRYLLFPVLMLVAGQAFAQAQVAVEQPTKAAVDAAQTTANTALSTANTAKTTADAATTAIANRPGTSVYVQTAFGPMTTGTGTTTLLGNAAQYYFGSSAGRPLLRCDYAGQAYRGNLKGNYSLAAVGPGTVTAIMITGGTSQSNGIGNLPVGITAGWWDADVDIVCITVGTNTATIMASATITFQATNGATLSLVVGRGTPAITITTTGNAFPFDLQRTFTNASNTMQVETMRITWIK